MSYGLGKQPKETRRRDAEYPEEDFSSEPNAKNKDYAYARKNGCGVDGAKDVAHECLFYDIEPWDAIDQLSARANMSSLMAMQDVPCIYPAEGLKRLALFPIEDLLQLITPDLTPDPPKAGPAVDGEAAEGDPNGILASPYLDPLPGASEHLPDGPNGDGQVDQSREDDSEEGPAGGEYVTTKQKILELIAGGMGKAEVARTLGVSRSTLYRLTRPTAQADTPSDTSDDTRPDTHDTSDTPI